MSTDREAQGSSSSGCCRGYKVTRGEIKKELIALMKLSWPVMTNQVLWFFLTVISIIFSGHLGQAELAAAALGQSVIHVAARSVFNGYATVCDTLFSQTYGSNNKKRVGAMLQRSLLTCTLVLIVCTGVLINTHPILLLFGQDPEVARLAGIYVYIYLIGAPMDVLGTVLVKYLQCQSHMIPTVIAMVSTTIMSAFLHYIIIYPLGYGLNGVMIAQVLAYYIQTIMLLIIIKWRNLHKKTWGGWTLDCLQEWGMLVKLGLSGAFMLCLEWWSFEIGFFVAGTLGNAAVGAHSVLFYCATLLWSAGGGLGIGGSIHIGNLLGSHQPRRARLASLIVTILGVLLGMTFAIMILLARMLLVTFSQMIKTLEVLSEVIILLGFFEIIDQMNGVNSGTIKGAGHQFFGALVNFICITCIAIPLFMVLVFALGFGIEGIWIGLLVGFSLQAICMVIFLVKVVNWKAETEKAKKRSACTNSQLTQPVLAQDSEGNIIVVESGNPSETVGHSVWQPPNNRQRKTGANACTVDTEDINLREIVPPESKHSVQDNSDSSSNSEDGEDAQFEVQSEISPHMQNNNANTSQSDSTERKISEITTQTQESDFEESDDDELEPLKPNESSSPSGRVSNSTPVQTVVLQDGSTQITDECLEEMDVPKSSLENDVLTVNPMPLRKLFILRGVAFGGCMLWLCGAIAGNVVFHSVFAERFVSLHALNGTGNVTVSPGYHHF